MNDSDLLMGFRRCKNEIKSLREQNKVLSAKVDTMDRILNAVNNHRQPSTCDGMSEDIIWNIEQTERFLEKEIEAQKSKEPLPKLHDN